MPALAMPADHPGILVVVAPSAGARRLDLLHRRGQHEPSPAAQLVADALTTG